MGTPMSTSAIAQMMWGYAEAGDYVRAERLAKQIPRHPRSDTVLAVAAWARGEAQAACMLSERAAWGQDIDWEILKVAARCHAEAGLWPQAIGFYREALAHFPCHQTKIDLGNALLCGGAWEEAWELLESRVPGELRRARFSPKVPKWDGEATRTLLVLPEGGYGDIIMSLRFDAAAKAAGAGRVIWMVPKALGSLLESQGIEAWLSPDPPPHTAWVFHMSLAHTLGISIDTLPTAPYLSLQPRFRLPRGSVAVAWGGSPLQPRDHIRSLPTADLRTLLSAPLGWQVVQQGPALSRAPKDMQLNLCPAKDFLETAQTLVDCDFVITIDTSVAHLAGALGRPGVVLLATTPDYRYRPKCWYDTLSLAQQPIPGQWGPAISHALELANAHLAH